MRELRGASSAATMSERARSPTSLSLSLLDQRSRYRTERRENKRVVSNPSLHLLTTDVAVSGTKKIRVDVDQHG
jgi:hypothetical protein